MKKGIFYNKQIWVIFIVALATTFALTYPDLLTEFSSQTYAGTDSDVISQPKALAPPFTGSWYISDTASVPQITDNDIAPIKIRFFSNQGVVTFFRFWITWNSDSLNLISVDTAGYNWPSGFSFDTLRHPQGSATAETIEVYGSKTPGSAIDSVNALCALKFKVICLTDGGPGTPIKFDTSSGGGDKSYFIISGSPYRPDSTRHGKVTLATFTLSSAPGKDTVIIDSTFRVPIRYTTNFIANQGFRDTFVIEFPKVKYDGLDKIGTQTETVNLIDSLSSDSTTIMVKTGNTNYTVPKGNNDILVYLKLKNKMTANKQWAKVRLNYSKFIACPAAFAEQTDDKIDSVYTLYEATASLENETTQRNQQDSLEVFLKNNFQVWMADTVPQNKVASLRIDTTWNARATFQTHVDDTINVWRWDRTLARYGIRFKESSTLSSNSIPINANSVRIFRMVYNAADKDTTIDVRFRVFNDSLTDNQFTDYVKSQIIIRPTTTTDPSNTLVLADGSITVVPPPPPPSSCPFLYVWNGNQYLEDNDILTTSEFTVTSTPVVDYYKLTQPLVEQNGQYLLQLREVEDEESFVDEVALITVDHPQSVKVGITPEGKIVAYDRALFPVACVDQEGKDHLDKILTNDGVIFEGDGPAALVLTFNNPSKKELPNDIRPEGAPGDEGNGPPPPKNGFGLSTKLTVEIEDANGQWHDLGVVAPRVNTQGSFWILGSTGIDLGEQFRVKLYWDKRYSVDRLAYYVPTAKPWYQETLRLTQAGHSKKIDVTSLVSAYDGNSAKLIPGEIISMAFPVGKPVPDGMVRDFIFKSVGYYIPYDRASAAGTITYKLHNNNPNPFNAQTEIQYALPEPSEVNLSVYNIMGQKVRTLVEGRQSAGVHRVIWGGKNEKGEIVASGVYFYTIRAGTYIETKKMTLLK